jgi:hypothetical protein
MRGRISPSVRIAHSISFHSERALICVFLLSYFRPWEFSCGVSVRAKQDQHSGNRTFFLFLSLAWIWIRNWILDFDSRTSERADDTLGGVSSWPCRHHTYNNSPTDFPFDFDRLIAFSPELLWYGVWFAAPRSRRGEPREEGRQKRCSGEVTICFWL